MRKSKLSPLTSTLVALALVFGILVADLTNVRNVSVASAQGRRVLVADGTLVGERISAKHVRVNGRNVHADFVGSIRIVESLVEVDDSSASKGGILPSGERAGGILPSGEVSADSGGVLPSGEETTELGGILPSGEVSADSGGILPSGERTGGILPSGELTFSAGRTYPGDNLEISGGVVEGDNVQIIDGVIQGDNLRVVGAVVRERRGR